MVTSKSGPRTVSEIEQAIADLKRRWPAHSVPPAMLRRLEELEDELAAAEEREVAANA